MVGIKHILFVDCPGASVVTRYCRLHLRLNGEMTEIVQDVRVIIASSFGFIITSDAIRICALRHIEVIITDVAQRAVSIYAATANWNASRASLTVRMSQFKALLDPRKRLSIAKDIVAARILGLLIIKNRRGDSSIGAAINLLNDRNPAQSSSRQCLPAEFDTSVQALPPAAFRVPLVPPPKLGAQAFLHNLPAVSQQGTAVVPGSPGSCEAQSFGYGLGSYTAALDQNGLPKWNPALPQYSVSAAYL
jgi:CRISPR associated protein Cas1